MTLSIVHRATGIALYFGMLLLAWWLIAVGAGPGAYATVQAFTGSWIGKLIVFGYTWSLMHHLLSGIRHFIWDLGYGFEKKTADRMALFNLVAGLVLTALVVLSNLDKRDGRDDREPPRRKMLWVYFLIASTLLGAASALWDKFLIVRYDRLAIQAYTCYYQSLMMIVIVLTVAQFKYVEKKVNY